MLIPRVGITITDVPAMLNKDSGGIGAAVPATPALTLLIIGLIQNIAAI